MATRLDGSNKTYELERGIVLRAPGLTGMVDVRAPRTATSRGPEMVNPALDAALANTNVTEVATVDISGAAAVPAPRDAAPMRSRGNADALELLVPDRGPDFGNVVLSVNEAGGVTWIFPEERTATAKATVRGAGASRRFLIPRTPIAKPPATELTSRSLLGAIGKKILKVFVYKITDPIIGPIGEHFARKWEEKNRPYGVRLFTPQNYTDPTAPQLTDADWKKLASGPSLLFVHGTFSTAHGAFGALPKDVLEAIAKQYDGRVFAFNHFTMSDDPTENVKKMLERMPAGVKLNDVDIICHSRGGLVARVLAENPFGVDTTRVNVRRVIFVAAPNAGTALAERDHMMDMIDRFTNVMKFIPENVVTEFLEAVITAVKVIGHAGLASLTGLRSMDPNEKFLKTLNATGTKGTIEYGALAANYEPTDAALISVIRVADAAMDKIFRDQQNDLVVPTLGVFEKNGSAYFPIDKMFTFDDKAGIMHTSFFGSPKTAEMIKSWLGVA